MRALLITDHPSGDDALASLLRAQNITVQHASADESLTDAADTSLCVLLVAHNSLPDDSENFVQHLRQVAQHTPMIVLSDTADAHEQVRLLDLGADEVLSLPIVDELLMAHIRTLMRRCEPVHSAVLNYEDLKLDLRSLELSRAGESIPCTSRELAIMEFLLRNPQRIVSRQELVEAIWDSSVQPDSNVIEVFIARLRRKLDKPFPTRLIHTLVGRGYMLSITRPGMEATARTRDSGESVRRHHVVYQSIEAS